MIFVADWANHRVQVFDSEGNYDSSVGTLGTGDGQFNGPNGLVITKVESELTLLTFSVGRTHCF